MDDTVKCSYFQFAAKFCNELDKTKNSVFSPLLVAEIVNSAKALKNIVSLNDVSSDGVQVADDNMIPLSCNLMAPKYTSIRGVTVNRASKIYTNVRRKKLKRKQKKTVKESINVKIKNMDLNSTDAVDLINKRVKKKTKGKIKDILNYNDLDVNANCVLVNGLYFKGLWHMKFDPDDTEETIFHLNNNEHVNVFLMYRKEKYNYKDCVDLDAQLLLLPFKNKEAHMLIVLPKRITGLDGVLQKLSNGYDIMEEVGEMTNDVEVKVSIPRFTIESKTNVGEVLHKLGIATVFDIAVQKVLIDVNEEGTEPKPERMKCGFIPRWKPRPIDFIADRPHLIIIIYESIPLIWITFRGRFD